jgi:hypothetical protein
MRQVAIGVPVTVATTFRCRAEEVARIAISLVNMKLAKQVIGQPLPTKGVNLITSLDRRDGVTDTVVPCLCHPRPAGGRGRQQGREDGLRAAVLALARVKPGRLSDSSIAAIEAVSDERVWTELVALLGQARSARKARAALDRALACGASDLPSAMCFRVERDRTV